MYFSVENSIWVCHMEFSCIVFCHFKPFAVIPSGARNLVVGAPGEIFKFQDSSP